MRRKLRAVPAGLLAAIVAATMALTTIGPAHASDEAAAQSTTFVDESTLPFEPVPGFEDSERLWGVHQGAGYRIEVPANWNGNLVIFAHGFRGLGDRLFFIPEEFPFRPYLIENGYAWAASTYSQNNYSVGNAVTDTRRLATLFRQTIDRPELTYLVGQSMGGHVVAASIERHPNFYDGVLSVCGDMGHYEYADYFLDYVVTAQQLALGSSEVPSDFSFATETAAEIKAGLEAEPGGWPTALNERGEAFKQLIELRSGGDRPNFDEGWAFWNSIPNFGSGIPGNLLFDVFVAGIDVGTGGGQAFKNTDVYYETDLVPGPSNDIEIALNDEVVRIQPDPGARRLTRTAPFPELRGYIREPVLTLHNLGDLFSPFHNQTVYHDLVADKGQSDLLVQRAIRGSLHCDFTTAEYQQGFVDLANWVENGVKPEGDPVGDPTAVAEADFGCRFTDPTPGAHPFAAPCPDAGS